jgi:hypothetical protein
MFDGMKRLLGLGATPATTKPARERARSVSAGEGRLAWDAGRAERLQARRRVPPPRVSLADVVEETCKTCGSAMLVEWGGSCPSCRPKLASPKTLFGDRSDLLGVEAVTLGWLVPLRTPDVGQRGKLILLVQPRVTLTRRNDAENPRIQPEMIALADNHVSSAHASITRPKGTNSSETFVLRDRLDPGPSSNGTFLNGRKLDPKEVAQLSDGDLIRVGNTEILFRSLWLPPGDVKG